MRCFWLFSSTLALLASTPFMATRAARAQVASLSMYGQSAGETRHLMPQVVVRTPSFTPIRAEAAYLVDVASRASIDLRAGGATSVTQTHRELSGRLGYDWSALRVQAHYRYVHRPDYVSHTIDLPVAYGLSDWASSFAIQPYLRLNEISGRPGFEQHSRMFGLRLTYQPWIDGLTVGLISYELQAASGYLSDPYDFVGLGGGNPQGCTGANFCVPEHNPDSRLEHALRIFARRALTESMSVGLSYRFFFDDWAMTSHTLEPDFAWLAWPGGLLRVRYRAYFQSATTAYRNAHPTRTARTVTPPMDLAANPLWAPLQTHRVSLDAAHTWTSPDAKIAFTTQLSFGVLWLMYGDAYNSDVAALEGTLSAALAI